MTKADVIKIINQVGEDFGWQMGKVGANYENGYMKAIRDCKAVFQKEEHIREDTKKVVTNADRIRNMSDVELANFITNIHTKWIDEYEYFYIVEGKQLEEFEEIVSWMKEKVE